MGEMPARRAAGLASCSRRAALDFSCFYRRLFKYIDFTRAAGCIVLLPIAALIYDRRHDMLRVEPPRYYSRRRGRGAILLRAAADIICF